MENIIRTTKIENLTVEELANVVAQDNYEYIKYVYGHPGKYRRQEKYGSKGEYKFYSCVWYKES